MTVAYAPQVDEHSLSYEHDAFTADRDMAWPPRVSIGLPVYNGEAFIRQTLDSVQAQTFTDFELIVSDNASSDRTVEIVQEYMQRDARIKLFENDQNRGATYNYNRVLTLASGEYFRWIAADDVIRPEFLAAAVSELDANPSVVLAYAKAAFIDEHDRVLYPFDDVMRLKPWSTYAVRRAGQMLRAVFTNGSAANVIVFGLARTAALRSIRPLGNYFGCDYAIVTDMALLGELREISPIMAFYRRHQESSSTYNRPSAASQQVFLDPGVSGRVRQEIQLRRRYFEIFRGIARARLSLFERFIIMLIAVYLIFQRIGWRIGYELRQVSKRATSLHSVEMADGERLHWSEFS